MNYLWSYNNTRISPNHIIYSDIIITIRLNDSAHPVDINGFKFLHKYRQNRTGGGVGLYISNDLEFKLLLLLR